MKFKAHNFVNLELAKAIFEAIKSTFPNFTGITSEQIYSMLSPPPKSGMGDLAFGCFPLAKALKLAPNQIATTLSEVKLDNQFIKETKAFGPYLNVFLNHANIAPILAQKIASKAYFTDSLIETAPKTIIEFSQPNTHKEMHVGHMRNLCLGDAFIKLHRYAGVDTISTTFPGDVGAHVAKCLWYFKNHNKEEVPKDRKGAWLGTLYTKGNNLLDEQKGTDLEAQNKKELTQILVELHARSGEYFDLWTETREWSIDLMKGVYNWAGVSFDKWYWESDVDASSVALVEEYLEKGLFIKDDGAVGVDLSDDKLGFCLLLKSDGTGLYATKDLELARRKFEDQKIEKSIYVVDNRQSRHFKQVFKTLEKMGFEYAKDCYHLQYEMVELTNGAMSSRKGNIVPLQSLVDEMVETIKIQFLKRYESQWSADEINKTANIVAAGAIKYGMTRVDSNKKIIFNMQEWLKLDGESGPYIQYVHARINSMVAKVEPKAEANYELLTNPLEIDIINKVLQFNTVIETSLKQYKTHLLCGYLYDLAKAFNSFYAECSVAKAETPELVTARRELCVMVKTCLKEGLGLLGIIAPERM